MTANQHNPFLFACGVPRSGTTLLQRMLNSHPELAVANDSHFIPRALELTDKSLVHDAVSGNPIALTEKIVDNVRQYHRFYRLEISDVDFDAINSRSETYQQLVAGLYDKYADNYGKRLAGEKTPDYVRRLELLHGLFPEAKLIHLIRDGRDVALSLQQWATAKKGPGRIDLWKRQPVAVCALWWRWLVMAGVEQAREIDPAVYIEIKYESLTQMPAEAMADLCQFLDLQNSPKMLEYNQGKTRQKSKLSAKSAWLAPKTGLRDWQHDMPEKDVGLFEALASDALQHFGYEIRNQRIPADTQDLAVECLRWWNQNFLPKHAKQNPDERCSENRSQPVTQSFDSHQATLRNIENFENTGRS